VGGYTELKNRERREEGRAAHQRGEEESTGPGGHRSMVITGEGRSLARRASHQRAERSQREERRGGLWLGLGLETFFKTRYGRTEQSTVPVWCTPDRAQ
jgi:hypothetical protein